ncbi:integrin beta-2 isoform X2 [Scomber japonicus]|uniref:integrin beta-2 isoform X2 n=1 Tax=Scomber japonicus TaxID=13676 RepID=UPI0023064A36|nr:integrin beta-2 isoform X2 [Scomber japonicus]
MDRHLLLLLIVMARNGLCQNGESCSKSVVNSCSDCIKSGPDCVWCQKLNFTKAGEQEAARCDTKAKLMDRGCEAEDIISPENKLTVVKKVPLSQSFNQQEPIQLSPQTIELKLRPGFGAFVDKTVLPYTNTNEEKLRRPCDETDQYCQAAFGYRHVLSMTPSEDEFKEKVTEQFISGNLDSPEGSLDAMMQAAVCGEKIGWRNSSTRLIVLTTDDGFHMAGDGKLAGILEPNDEACHMQNNLYVKSSEMDYPSVGQLVMQLKKNNIQPIFAVTKKTKTVYQQLSDMIPKSVVGVLSEDSKNVVDLINNAYRSLSSKVTLTHENLPDNVRVVYTPKCEHPESAQDNKGVCNNVPAGTQISFDVTLTADSCMEDTSFTIRPLGIKDTLTVSLSTICECVCKNHTDVSGSAYCNSHGKIQCGICSCKDGYVGQACECSTDEREERAKRASCQKSNNTQECEGRGDCVCGRCRCHTTESGNSYHGDYCECDDESCEKFQNQLCGGHGECKCGDCICDADFEGSACECRKSDQACRTPDNTVCYGRGKCKCNRCECEGGYQRPNCQKCIGCPDSCQTKLNCIECLGFESGPFKKNCTVACSSILHYQMVDRLTLSSKECKQKDSEGCWIKFKLDQLVGKDNYTAEIQKQKECPEPPSVTAIIGGSVAGVAVIGILLLMLLKLLIYMKDMKEWKKFENEKKKSKWAEADNPLFQDATTTVTNPTFTGE